MAGAKSHLRNLRNRQAKGQLAVAFELVRETGEGREGRRLILLPARQRLAGRMVPLGPLMLIVVTIKTEQLPVAAVRRIIVVVMVFVMNGELAQLLAVEFATAMRTEPWKQFERLLPIALLQLSLGASCHASLGRGGNLVQRLCNQPDA